jgi:uncharacterized protein
MLKQWMLPLAATAGLVVSTGATGAEVAGKSRGTKGTRSPSAVGKKGDRMESKSRFLEAVKSGDLNKVKALMAQEPPLVNATDEGGVAVVLVATYHGHKAVADALIAAGAQLDVFGAAATGQTRRLQALLKEDPRQVDRFSPDGFTALHLAAFFGQAEEVDLLLTHGADPKTVSKNSMRAFPINSASASANEKAVVGVCGALLARGANATSRMEGGNTPLHEAAQRGNLELAKLLISKGADMNATLEDGRTPLALAAARKHEALVELFQKNGATR